MLWELSLRNLRPPTNEARAFALGLPGPGLDRAPPTAAPPPRVSARDSAPAAPAAAARTRTRAPP